MVDWLLDSGDEDGGGCVMWCVDEVWVCGTYSSILSLYTYYKYFVVPVVCLVLVLVLLAWLGLVDLIGERSGEICVTSRGFWDGKCLLVRVMFNTNLRNIESVVEGS